MEKEKHSYCAKRNSVFRKKLTKQATHAEKIVFAYLKDMGIRFRFQKGFFTPFHQIVDFYLPQSKIALQIDGKIHDTSQEQDKRKDKALLQRGIKTIRIKNEQTYDNSFHSIIDSIKALPPPKTKTQNKLIRQSEIAEMSYNQWF